MSSAEARAAATRAFSLLAHAKFHWNLEHGRRALFSAEYERFLTELARIAQIVPLRDLPVSDPAAIRVGLRFDVDGDLLTAVHTASVEHRLGVPATYFFLPTADYYGRWEKGVVERDPGALLAVRYLQDALGREIGYHDDWIRLFVEHGIEPERGLSDELGHWRAQGLRVASICSHNSAYVHGIGSFEIWYGQSIDGRREASAAGRTVRLGHLSLAEFGLEYDANFITEVTWRDAPLEMHGRRWERAERMSRDVDFQFFVGFGGLCTVQRGRGSETVASDVPLADMPRMIRDAGPGTRWLLLGHPEYFASVPTVDGVRDAYAQWATQTGPRGGFAGRVDAAWEAAMSRSRAAFVAAERLRGGAFVRRPASLRATIRRYSRANSEGIYWENSRAGVHFMAPYMERTFDFVSSLSPGLESTSVLDLAGGCGNLGLALMLHGLATYTLNDIHTARIEWAKRLFRDYGLELDCSASDLRTARFARHYEFVALLGWENFEVTYEEAVAAARRWQAPGGWLLLTYQDYDEYRIGGWGDLYREWHDREARYRDGLYTVSRQKLVAILEGRGYRTRSMCYAGHEVSARGYYPQYLLGARLEA